MEWFERYKQQLVHVFKEAEQSISAFPPPLDSIGLAYVDRFNPVKHDNGKDYICTLLPYWLKEATGINDEQCKRFVLANIYGMLYFFIQDDVMDRAPAPEWKEKLALGNLFYLEMLQQFRILFPSQHPFWSYYHQYVTTWADCVVNEQSEHYFLNDPIRTAGKAAPVKIAGTGAWLLREQPGSIPVTEEAIDLVLMTLQMLDDWADWRTDREEGSYNGLLSMIAAEQAATEQPVPGSKQPSIDTLTIEAIEAAIYVHGCMRSYTEVAHRNHEQLLKLQCGIFELVGYHTYMIDCLNTIVESIDSTKNKLIQGGFNYYFSKNE